MGLVANAEAIDDFWMVGGPYSSFGRVDHAILVDDAGEIHFRIG